MPFYLKESLSPSFAVTNFVTSFKGSDIEINVINKIKVSPIAMKGIDIISQFAHNWFI